MFLIISVCPFLVLRQKLHFLKETYRLTKKLNNHNFEKDKIIYKNQFFMFSLIRHNFRLSQEVLKKWLFWHFVLFFLETITWNTFTVYDISSFFFQEKSNFYRSTHEKRKTFLLLWQQDSGYCYNFFLWAAFFCYKRNYNNFFFT